MSYRCCSMIERFALNVNGRIDTGEPVFSLCCENLPDIPKIPMAETAENTLRTFVGEGLLAAVECARVMDNSQRHFTAGCVNCAQFQEGEHNISPLMPGCGKPGRESRESTISIRYWKIWRNTTLTASGQDRSAEIHCDAGYQ